MNGGLWLGAAVVLLSLGCDGGEPAVATELDLARFQGRWHEIARVPRDHDATCHDTIADYRLTSPSTLEVIHRCHVGGSSGPVSEVRAVASRDDEAAPAKLSLEIGLYRGAYWVLDVGADYEFAVIGHPSRSMAWVLSREPKLDAKTYDAALGLLTREGFGTHLLRTTPRGSDAAWPPPS